MKLKCSCCGADAPGKQWWNQDKGTGICATCFDRVKSRDGESEAVKSYGHIGIHHSINKPNQMKGNMTKLCKDCRYHHESAGGKKYAKCLHSKAADPSGGHRLAEWLVTGEGEKPDDREFYFCSTMRECSACGTEGRLWEPREGATVISEPEVKGAP